MSVYKEIEFKNYLQGVGDPGTRLMFKFRSGTNGLNEGLGRHRGQKRLILYIIYVHLISEASISSW